jgi:hypothetical protein
MVKWITPAIRPADIRALHKAGATLHGTEVWVCLQKGVSVAALEESVQLGGREEVRRGELIQACFGKANGREVG